ncbi:pectin acetylesterase-family hydrolase [Bdellovibrionota bacterium FG-1]
MMSKGCLLRQVLLCLVFGLSVVSGAQAQGAQGVSGRHWKEIKIDGAYCGDGAGYSVFLSEGASRKIAFDLMGGGACWSASTCYGLPESWIHPLPGVFQPSGFVSSNPALSPVADFTLVYFPYCTGDVHLGRHVATYQGGMKVRHEGRLNFEKSVTQLIAQGLIELPLAEEFVMTGFSAGALGALLHSTYVAPLIKNVPDKTLILDAPGLHFGQKFWDKFPKELIDDYADALQAVGFALAPGEGNIAGVIPLLCQRLPGWRVGVLQGSRDVVMSGVFGAISPEEHEKLVYGPGGLEALTQDATDNCAAWVPSSEMHTFLVTDETASIKANDGTSAMDFVRELVSGTWRGGRAAGPNHL